MFCINIHYDGIHLKKRFKVWPVLEQNQGLDCLQAMFKNTASGEMAEGGEGALNNPYVISCEIISPKYYFCQSGGSGYW